MAKHTLTDVFVKKAAHPATGQVLYFDDHKDAPTGFALRVTPNAKAWVLNYYVEGKQRRYTLPLGYPDLGPTAARRDAAKVRTLINAGGDPLATKAATKRAKAAANRAAAENQEKTLGRLLTLYADNLERAGKYSAQKVRGQIRRHVENAHPDLWIKPLAEFEDVDAVTLTSSLKRAGKMREAGKLRATIRAAFGQAAAARLDDDASEAMRSLNVRVNPVLYVPAGQGTKGGTSNHVLKERELRSYWNRISAMPDVDGALLRLHLLTGSQRLEQLVRATNRDLDLDAKLLTLFDPKGRRSKGPRLHAIPLLPEAIAAVKALTGVNAKGVNFVFSGNGGRTAISAGVLGRRIVKVSTVMAEAGEVSDVFTAADLRRTVETVLAARGVAKETRAHLQSHGLHGVQHINYDRHDYYREKLSALETLRNVLDEPGAVVVPLRRVEA